MAPLGYFCHSLWAVLYCTRRVPKFFIDPSCIKPSGVQIVSGQIKFNYTLVVVKTPM